MIFAQILAWICNLDKSVLVTKSQNQCANTKICSDFKSHIVYPSF